MLNLANFLDQIAEIRVSNILRFGFDPAEGRRCIFVGCGTIQSTSSCERVDTFVFNNKATWPHFKRRYDSLAKFIEDPPAGFLESWDLWGARPIPPHEVLQRVTLVVDDASPDSIFGVLVLLGRLAGVPIEQIPAEWIAAVDDWERTGVVDEPYRSWCALVSALAHARYPVAADVSCEALAAAWTDGLHFAAACLARHASPNTIPELRDIKEWHAARAALHQEERLYHDLLQRATIAQLLLPLSFSPDRRILLDGMFIAEIS
jgi:hypothetical protein